LSSSPQPDTPRFCDNCGTPLAPLALSCPSCHQLVHAAALEDLAQRARELETANNRAGAAALWRQALALLPPESAQAKSIRDRVSSLGFPVDPQPPGAPRPAPSGSKWASRLGPAGAVAVLLSKAKFLLLGLGQLKTILSMLAFMGVYWSLYGWRFALGFVLGIYVHEMGHVWMLRHYGMRASAPMFIPGFGAFISLYDSPSDVHQDARIGLAGPLWGTGAAIFTVLVAFALGGGVWTAVAHATAYINLFNLTPVWSLDGGRAFRALDYQQRLLWFGLAAVLWWFTGSGLFLLLLAGAAYRIFWKKDHAPAPDQLAFAEFAGLMIILGVLIAWIPGEGARPALVSFFYGQ
jgi:Zn-dependent protease